MRCTSGTPEASRLRDRSAVYEYFNFEDSLLNIESQIMAETEKILCRNTASRQHEIKSHSFSVLNAFALRPTSSIQRITASCKKQEAAQLASEENCNGVSLLEA
jgi:hypothetical protein